MKARDIVRCRQFSHEACGRDPFYWFSRVGYMRGTFGVGENLAYGTRRLGTPRANMRSWLHSPGHRRALLDPAFREIGIGLVRGRYLGSRRAEVWVAHLGYRR